MFTKVDHNHDMRNHKFIFISMKPWQFVIKNVYFVYRKLCEGIFKWELKQKILFFPRTAT